MAEVMHLDSSLLRGMLDSLDDSRRRSESKHLFNSLTALQFRVSLLAVGEVLGKMAESRSASVCAEAAAELSRLFRGSRLDLYGIGKGTEAFVLAFDIMNADALITPADAFLVACALVDDDCNRFATTDQSLLESRTLRSQAASHGVKMFDARNLRWKRQAAQIGREVNMRIPQETSSGPTA